MLMADKLCLFEPFLKNKSQDKKLPHELFLTTAQKTKIRTLLLTIIQQIKNLVKLKYLK